MQTFTAGSRFHLANTPQSPLLKGIVAFCEQMLNIIKKNRSEQPRRKLVLAVDFFMNIRYYGGWIALYPQEDQG